MPLPYFFFRKFAGFAGVQFAEHYMPDTDAPQHGNCITKLSQHYTDLMPLALMKNYRKRMVINNTGFGRKQIADFRPHPFLKNRRNSLTQFFPYFHNIFFFN